ncbi:MULTISPECIES: methyltransferase [unclassified Pseudoalteromonas]|uniref:methyltransferase n=1 Tax=unclassified Pseudoalteromonas TaxID=194690 RepID=UPI0020980AB0|nr:methyltransferase [Pseudoalteromonas sp. XMcav2-N]MCO7190755.1 SAM-dependent methyltransferase [Pseudoalteromonas sp. XMcav2-N]
MRSSFHSQFLALDALLADSRQYWQLLAFDHTDIPWPELKSTLLSLSDEEVTALDQEPAALLSFLTPYISGLSKLPTLTALTLEPASRPEFPFWLSNGIKGRKLTQLQDFVGQIAQTKLPVLEWCAGKGHLGRLLAYQGAVHVDSVELQAALCQQGQHSAQQQGLAMTFHCADVLKDPIEHYFKPQQQAVALHACGRLHQTFMAQACAAGCEQISLSPCCYHLFTEPAYLAMSDAAAQSILSLSHSDMKLALQETVTAPGRVAKVRKREVQWRLAFDALRRDVTGDTQYLSVPSVNKAIFSGSFVDFCHWAADQKQLDLPAHFDADHYLAQGRARQRITERIELVRHAFRRAIELWLVLDRVLYLEQAGYDVSLSEFCHKSLTPRNILIQATRCQSVE